MKTMKLWVALAGMIALGTSGWACSVPVFRYALERWPADPFEVTIFHRGALTGAEQEIVKALTQAGDQAANVALTTVDVSQSVPAHLTGLWASNQTTTLPAMIVQFPRADRIERPCWIGPLTVDNTRRLVDSPARREIAQRILKGDSAVWVLLEGENAEENNRAAQLLENELGKLQKEMQLPELDLSDPRVNPDIELKIQFSLLRVSRSDPAEQLFVAMLLGTDEALGKVTGPIVYPIYGRGRALVALTPEHLTADNIAQVAYFVCGSCSCEIKSLNPGVDLLVAADWDGGLMGRAVQDPPLPPLVSLSELAAAAGTGTPVAMETAAIEPAGTGSLLRNVVIVLLGAVAVLAIVSKALRAESSH